jgi:hypothetical protein
VARRLPLLLLLLLLPMVVQPTLWTPRATLQQQEQQAVGRRCPMGWQR